MPGRVKSATVGIIGIGILSAAIIIAVSLGASINLTPGDDDSDQPLAQLHDGVLGFPAECASCHGDRPEYPLAGARTQYVESGHFLGFNLAGTHAYYANGGGCQSCHTHGGSLEYLDTGKREASPFINWLSPPGCFTCHEPHETGNFSLRTIAPVALINEVVIWRCRKAATG